MPTRPARVPFDAPMRSHTTWPVAMYSKAISSTSVDRVPPAAESVVLIAASAAMGPAPIITSAEPGLKPYHPNQRMKTPRIARDALWPGMLWGCMHVYALSAAEGFTLGLSRFAGCGQGRPRGAQVNRHREDYVYVDIHGMCCARVAQLSVCKWRAEGTRKGIEGQAGGLGRGQRWKYLAVCIEAADAGSDDECAGKGCEAARHMHHSTSCKIDDAGVEQQVSISTEGRDPAGGAPHPCTTNPASR